MTIGQFSALTRLSVKQLRDYQDVGLVVPASVNSHNGYRYYHRGQAGHAMSAWVAALAGGARRNDRVGHLPIWWRF